MSKAFMLKFRGGSGEYVKRDGSKGTAGRGFLIGENCAYTITTLHDQTLFQEIDDAGNYVARRLTPLESERLQGFPDNWTEIPYRGKSTGDCPDAPRYKAIGNSMAVPVMRWIGERLQMVDKILNG